MQTGDITALIQELQSDDEARAIAAARSLGERRDRRAVEALIDLLKHTDAPRVRNAAAVALGDIGDDRAIAALVQTIADPKTEGFRGSMVYALQSFDNSRLVPFLVDLVINDNWEVSHEALLAIQTVTGEIEPAIWDLSKKKVQDALPGASGYKLELLRELAEMFDESGKPESS